MSSHDSTDDLKTAALVMLVALLLVTFLFVTGAFG